MLTKFFRLGADAEIRDGTNGKKFATLNLAYDYYNHEAKKRDTQWVETVYLDSASVERLGDRLVKGANFTGSLEDVHVRNFTKKDGTPGSALAGRLISIENLRGPKPSGEAASEDDAASAGAEGSAAPF